MSEWSVTSGVDFEITFYLAHHEVKDGLRTKNVAKIKGQVDACPLNFMVVLSYYSLGSTTLL
jgi:hypothetical protein